MRYLPAEGVFRFLLMKWSDRHNSLPLADELSSGQRQMKIRFPVQILLIFLALSVCTFDRHLIYYYPGGLSFLINIDATPVYSDQSVESSDHQEDITVKDIFCSVPAPAEVPVSICQNFHPSIPRCMPHTIWQPPEKSA